jgi:Putative Flp pilus-assembly TadE/G-like
VVALMLTVLLAFAALVVDVGLNWAARTQAQQAADAAALAGVITLPSDPVAAVEDVRYYLNANVPGLAGAPGWEHNLTDADGDITCGTPPAEVPPPGTHGCQVGDTAIQVITPPIQVDYAFAGVFGQNGSQIKALAAAVRGPPVTGPTPCAICLLDRHAAQALSVTSNGDITVANAGVMVNSDHSQAAVLASSGNMIADWVGVVGGWTTTSSGRFTPTPDTGLGPLPDPLADLPTPDQLDPLQNRGSVTVGSADQPIGPGIYDTIAVTGGGDLVLDPGTYVVTGGLTLAAGAVIGSGVTIYLACAGYPTPCSGPGAAFSQNAGAQYLATPPTTGPYQGLALFADRGNTAPLSFTGSGASIFTGTIYARQAPMELTSGGVALQLDSLLVVRTLGVSNSAEILLSFDPANNAVTSFWGANLTK